jgi:hypothetical protein
MHLGNMTKGHINTNCCMKGSQRLMQRLKLTVQGGRRVMFVTAAPDAMYARITRNRGIFVLASSSIQLTVLCS